MSRRVLSTVPAQVVAICAIAATTLLMPVATPADARIATNGLSANRLAANKLATNRIATNRIALDGVASGKSASTPNPLLGLDRKAIAR